MKYAPVYQVASDGSQRVYNQTTIPKRGADGKIIKERMPEEMNLMQSPANTAVVVDKNDHHNENDDDDGDNEVNVVQLTSENKDLNEGLSPKEAQRKSIHRWLPKEQRQLLQKQAEVMCNSREMKYETEL